MNTSTTETLDATLLARPRSTTAKRADASRKLWTPGASGGIPLIRVAAVAWELEQLYRFRYRIYVEEMGRKQKFADHAAKRIEDPLDASATNLIAWEGDRVVGTVRVNFSRDADLHGYERFYQMDSVDAAHPLATSICTRFMIAPEHRHSPLAVRLNVAAYEFGLHGGITYNFIDCNEHLVPFFTRMGFVQYTPRQFHDEYGLVTCMRLALRDLRHLAEMSSPFVAPLKRWLSTRCTTGTEATEVSRRSVP